MEYSALPVVPHPGGKFPGNAIRLPVFDNGGNNTFKIGKSFQDNPQSRLSTKNPIHS
jgi:hypothetical protein